MPHMIEIGMDFSEGEDRSNFKKVTSERDPEHPKTKVFIGIAGQKAKFDTVDDRDAWLENAETHLTVDIGAILQEAVAAVEVEGDVVEPIPEDATKTAIRNASKESLVAEAQLLMEDQSKTYLADLIIATREG